MSIHAKPAALVIAILLAFTIYRVMSGVTVGGTRSSAEAILDFLFLSAFVCLFFSWRYRSQAKRQGPASRP